jgi:hypothetical protein
MTRIPFGSGDEQDALTKWRHMLYWHAGQRASIKRRYRRRERATEQNLIWLEAEEWAKRYWAKELDCLGDGPDKPFLGLRELLDKEVPTNKLLREGE